MTWIEKLAEALPNSVYALRKGYINTRTRYVIPTVCPRRLFGGTAPDSTDETCPSSCKYIRENCRRCWNMEVVE